MFASQEEALAWPDAELPNLTAVVHAVGGLKSTSTTKVSRIGPPG